MTTPLALFLIAAAGAGGLAAGVGIARRESCPRCDLPAHHSNTGRPQPMTVLLALIASITILGLASLALSWRNARANDRLNRDALDAAISFDSNQATRDAALAYLGRFPAAVRPGAGGGE